jgi:AcrR family transcriptional regulator
MRGVEYAETRRQELLDRAQTMFVQQGYENVSLNDVIAAAGTSKGVFYHYFRSKEALVTALAERWAAAAMARVGDVLKDASKPPAERLNTFLRSSWDEKTATARDGWALFGFIYRPENKVLFQLVTNAMASSILPALIEVIRQGAESGDFHTADPEGVAELLMQLADAAKNVLVKAMAGDLSAPEVVKALERRIETYERALNGALGVASGTIRLSRPGHVKIVLEARQPNSRRKAR